MLFHTLTFAAFFLVVFVIHFSLPHKIRKYLLLAASYYFYMSWNKKYIVLIFFTTVVIYLGAIFLEKAKTQKFKNLSLSLCLLANLALLFVFKYYNFSIDILTQILQSVSLDYNFPALRFLLPVGISFYTFQALGYLIDVYRGTIKAEKDFITLALFVSYFPQLVAGPIERASSLLPQLKSKVNIDWRRVEEGLHIIGVGLVQKVIVADLIAEYVNVVYGTPGNYQGLTLIIATYFFSFQIYCDFAGYSNIAIGCAKVFGVDLMKNFNRPYFASSVGEFWQRWHISLSTWFRDYLYIPLGGNRCSINKNIRNILIVFLLSGLWHGANLTFVFWGAIHSIYLIIERLLTKYRFGFFVNPSNNLIFKGFRIVFIFNLVSFTWIFFRAESLSDAVVIITNMFNFSVPQDLTVGFTCLSGVYLFLCGFFTCVY